MLSIMALPAAAPELPVELLAAVARFLPERDRSAAALVSRRWREAAWLGGRNLSWRAAARASPRMAEWALRCGLPVRLEGLERAAAGGNRRLVQWMLARGWPQAPRLLYAMLQGGLARESLALRHLAPEQRALQRAGLAEAGDLAGVQEHYDPDCAEDFWVGAARGAQEEVLLWLRAQGAAPSELAAAEAVAHGHLAAAQNLVRWGHAPPASLVSLLARDAPAWAAKHAHKRYGLPLTPACLAQAAQAGNQAAVEWLLEAGCPLEGVPLCAAVAGGSVAVFELLQAHGCAVDPASINEALGYCDNPALLERLAGWRSAANADACVFAAYNGYVPTLEWLAARGWPLTAAAAETAAAHGQLAALQWLRARGCPWSGRVRALAEQHYEWDVLQWLDAIADPV